MSGKEKYYKHIMEKMLSKTKSILLSDGHGYYHQHYGFHFLPDQQLFHENYLSEDYSPSLKKEIRKHLHEVCGVQRNDCRDVYLKFVTEITKMENEGEIF